MKNQLIIKELEEMSKRINFLMEELKKGEGNTIDTKIVNKDLMVDVIKKYVLKNGEILDKDKQKKLQYKLYCLNSKKEWMSLISIFKQLDIGYEYISSEVDSEWKDIRILN